MTAASLSHSFNGSSPNGNSFNDIGDLFKPSKQDRLFKQILVLLLVIYAVFGIGVPLLEQVEVPREVKEQLPPQLAKIMLKEKQLPVPEKPEVIPEPEPELEKEPEKVEEKPVDKPVEKPIVQPTMTREAAKEKAQTSGLAAMKDELFSMREAFDIKPASQSALEQTQAQEVKVKRKMLAASANTQSESLTTSTVNQTVASDALSTKNTQQIRLAEEEVLATQGAIAEEEQLASAGIQRSEAALRRTLEANKARLYALYNRALRKDPFLKGKVMFEIEILPNGSISRVDIQSSQLNNAKLERQLKVVLRSITFPAEDVATMTTIWAIDFLPS
ncbi:AgmX/PglI C-terminal domain-containing protein [Shewanella electrodiphila]|uniref:AgmX/PglI C-terminal domain-containing protein n=1 Tax=Shewanella electrodiphila TaxID=934143 RepID=A0ABT0KIZ3_9GAMM|nr:AgmX/PglI C-terminal domain-containing protein [Shewanella electrodiphila]MCL1043797.1 AgmX/PglI C-terminal domain-containing protein [Shewanella electrodiphila]